MSGFIVTQVKNRILYPEILQLHLLKRFWVTWLRIPQKMNYFGQKEAKIKPQQIWHRAQKSSL